MRSRPPAKRETKMAEYTFRVNLEGITALECFKEASKDEIKVLLAITSMRNESVSAEHLSEILEISKARVAAAITLFEESGVIEKCEGGLLAEVEYEFEPKKSEGVIASAANASVALRDGELAEYITAFENIFEKTLVAREVERINTLHKEKGLSYDYILTLASFLAEKYTRLSVERVVREATSLAEKNITTFEELEIYIRDKHQEVAGEKEMQSLFGIYGRAITKSERSYFKKWMHDYAYGKTIIEEAYDISTRITGKLSMPYIDSILTSWHTAGCTTLEECRTKENVHKQEGKQKVNNSSQKSKKNVEAETPKYTDFNSEDALMRALERSYGDSD